MSGRKTYLNLLQSINKIKFITYQELLRNFKKTLVLKLRSGIMLENMTGGRLRSTIHRVLDHGDERMSAPFFLEPGWDKQLCGKSYDFKVLSA